MSAGIPPIGFLGQPPWGFPPGLRPPGMPPGMPYPPFPAPGMPPHSFAPPLGAHAGPVMLRRGVTGCAPHQLAVSNE